MPPNAPEHEPDTITLKTPGNLSTMTIDGSRIFGPDIEIARYCDAYRGRSSRGIVDLRSENSRITGVVGSGTTDLHVDVGMVSDEPAPIRSQEVRAFHVRGMNAGKLGELEVRSDRIVGQLGGCAYDLHQSSSACGTTYSGLRSCGGLPEKAELTLPPGVVALDPMDRAALLAIFFAS
jgi:hypothetical protein